MEAETPIFLENVNFDGLIVISVNKMHQIGGGTCVFKKLYKPDHLNVQPLIPAVVNVRA